MIPPASDTELTNNYYTDNYFRGSQQVTADDFDDYNYTSTNVQLLSSGDGTGDSGGFNIGPHFFFNGVGSRELTVDFDLSFTHLNSNYSWQ